MQASTPISYLQASNKNLLIDNIYGFANNFKKKCVQYDINKSYKEVIFGESLSDCLLLDFADLRLDLLQLNLRNESLLVSDSFWFHEYENELKSILHYESEIKIPVTEYDIDYIKKLMVPLINLVNEKYKNKKVIILEVFLRNEYLDIKKGICSFNKNFEYQNSLISAVSRYMADNIENSYYIPMLNSALCDKNHTWGLGPLHFCKEVYEYFYDCINEIFCYGQKDFVKIKAYYERILTEIKKRYTILYDKNKWENYSNLFKRMVLENINTTILEKKLTKLGYNKIGLYGFTEPAKALVSLFKHTQIKIEYVVENGQNFAFNGLIIPRASETLPSADCVIIADIMNIDYLKLKLSKIVNYPIISIFDLLDNELNIID